jgi:hypothetical protein
VRLGCLWLGLGALAVPVQAALVENQPPPTRYELILSPQDVERVTGQGGLRLVPKDPLVGANGILNFARFRGPVILTLTGEDVDEAAFAKIKHSVAFQSMYAFQFKELGDDAYEGPAQNGNLYVLSFQKGAHWVTLTSGLSRRSGKPFLSMEQLRELAAVVLDRL